MENSNPSSTIARNTSEIVLDSSEDYDLTLQASLVYYPKNKSFTTCVLNLKQQILKISNVQFLIKKDAHQFSLDLYIHTLDDKFKYLNEDVLLLLRNDLKIIIKPQSIEDYKKLKDHFNTYCIRREFRKDYKLKKKIGRGSFARVFEAEFIHSDVKKAAKIYYKKILEEKKKNKVN